jgi:hypothetical protein
MANAGSGSSFRVALRADLLLACRGAKFDGERVFGGFGHGADAWFGEGSYMDRRVFRLSVRLLPEILAGYIAEA